MSNLAFHCLRLEIFLHFELIFPVLLGALLIFLLALQLLLNHLFVHVELLLLFIKLQLLHVLRQLLLLFHLQVEQGAHFMLLSLFLLHKHVSLAVDGLSGETRRDRLLRVLPGLCTCLKLNKSNRE